MGSVTSCSVGKNALEKERHRGIDNQEDRRVQAVNFR